MPEALAALDELSPDLPGLGLLADHLPRPPPPRLVGGAGGALAGQARSRSHVENLLAPLSPPAPASLPCATARPPSCRGSAACSASESRRSGVDRFGQTGNLADLYAAYRLDGDAITQSIAELLLTPS